MAIFEIRFRSEALQKDTGITVILPETCEKEDIPTLYLLHGMHGDHTSWARKTSIERYAAARQIAVVCPDGENSFYTNMRYGERYETYIADELVAYMHKVFRFSEKREKTFLAGLSMGGYGAFKLALTYPDRYAAAASLSGCLDLLYRFDSCPWEDIAVTIWGEDYQNNFRSSAGDLCHLLDTYPTDLPKPKLYAACGKQDSLYGCNLSFLDHLKGRGFDYTFEDGDGVHNWDFWDKWIPRALDVILN